MGLCIVTSMLYVILTVFLCGAGSLYSQTFLNFPYGNSNERAVGNNIDALQLQGAIPPGSDLASVINQFTGQPTSVVNNGLDQMHPAQYGTFAEIESETGAQILSLFCRSSFLSYPCRGFNHIWAQTFANWYDQKSNSEQVGFGSKTWGAALGYDLEIFEGWILGAGGAWRQGELHWLKGRGHAETSAYYGAFYSDYQTDDFYFGASFLAGNNSRFASRHIQFLGVNRHASAKSNALDVLAQVKGAYFFGIPTFLFYPFANVDLFYLHTDSIQEANANGLDLTIAARSDKTIRTEGGLALEVVDVNYDETISISPILAVSWVMQKPIGRDLYVAQFAGETLSFNTQGWDQTWQLWSAKLGLKLTYYCFTLSANYLAEITIESGDYFAQKCDIRFDYTW